MSDTPDDRAEGRVCRTCDHPLEQLEEGYLMHRKGDCIAALRADRDRLAALLAEAQRGTRKARRAATTFSHALELQVLAMQAAVIEMERTDPRNAMLWIYNTLEGPGLIPDWEEANRFSSANAWFSSKLNEEDVRYEAALASLDAARVEKSDG